MVQTARSTTSAAESGDIASRPDERDQRRRARAAPGPLRCPSPAILREFFVWCGERDVAPLAMRSDTLLEYYREAYDSARGERALRLRRASVELFYRQAGRLDLTQAPQILAFLAATAQGQVGPLRSPITDPELCVMVKECNKNSTELARRRDRAIVLLACRGGLSYIELKFLRRPEIAFFSSHALFEVPSPNALSSRARQIYVPRERDKQVCPVRALQEWFEIWRGDSFCGVDGYGHVSERTMAESAYYMVVHKYVARAARLKR